MKVNLICNLKYRVGDDTIAAVETFNEVVAWCLRQAFHRVGVDAVFVNDNHLLQKSCPVADHSLVISATAMKGVRQVDGYLAAIRAATRGTVNLYLDADYRGWDKYYDYVFTVVEPYPSSSTKFVYGGWGADPALFYPEQTERMVYVDAYMYGFYGGQYDRIYDKVRVALQDIRIAVCQPFPTYHNRQRIPWSQMAANLRKCLFYIGTQPGDSGLTRIEAATCGALLIGHPSLMAPRTWRLFEHATWGTPSELAAILQTTPNVAKNRARALQHTWDNVVDRMLKVWGER
jgi:hypothetical protein